MKSHLLRKLGVVGLVASFAVTVPVLTPSNAGAAPESDMRRVAVDLQPGRDVAPGRPADLEAASDHAAHEDEDDHEMTVASTATELASASAPIDAGEAVMVGATWTDDAVVEVRTRTDGEWGQWMRLHRDDEEHVPDPDSPEWDGAREGVSEPIWTGPVDQLQFRSTDPGALDVSLVDMVGGDGLAWTPDEPAAGAAWAAPKIHSRSAWGADESLRSGSPSYSSTGHVRFSVVHHAGDSQRWSSSEVANGCPGADDRIRAYYRYHTQSNGWSDIGYNFIVDPCGRIWEGRAGGVHRAVVGAHAGGFNDGSVGVLALGTFSGSDPDRITGKMIDGIERIVGYKLALNDVDPAGQTHEISGGGSARKPAGSDDWLPVLSAHQISNSTSCPGWALMQKLWSGSNEYGWPLDSYVAGVREHFDRERAGLSEPEPEPEPAPEPAPEEELEPTKDDERVGICPAPGDQDASFTDVDPNTGNAFGDSLARHILCQANYGIAGGYPDGSFRPSEAVTRAQMAKFIYNLIETGSPGTLDDDAPNHFSDVASGSAFEDYISALAKEGVVAGVADDRYDPEGLVTRAQMAKFVTNAIQATTGAQFVSSSHTNTFSDVVTGSTFEPFISSLAAEGVVSGVGSGLYAPDDHVTRGMMSLFTIRAGQNAWEKGHWAATEGE